MLYISNWLNLLPKYYYARVLGFRLNSPFLFRKIQTRTSKEDKHTFHDYYGFGLIISKIVEDCCRLMLLLLLMLLDSQIVILLY